MTTNWGRQRRYARQAGREAADGGEDQRRKYDSMGVVHSYDEGYRERTAEIEAERELAERLSPLREIANDAQSIIDGGFGNPEDIARLVLGLTEYLIEKESN